MHKLKRISLPLIAVLLSAFSCAHAQASGSAKIAVIYSGVFQDGKAGISRYVSVITKVNAEFQPLQNELNQTAQRLKGLEAEIAKMQQGATPATPAQIQTKIDQLDQQKTEYKRKAEDAQANYQKRRADALRPLQEDVAKALDAFAKARGITILLDGSQVPITFADDTIDVTDAFISEYNKAHPVTP